MGSRILLPIATYPDSTPTSALEGMTALAAMLGAQVTAVVHNVDIPPLHNPAAEFVLKLEAASEAAEALSRSRGVELSEMLRQFCRQANVTLAIEFFKSERPAGEKIAARARSFDLTMMACQLNSPDHALLLEEVLFGSGAPVILFPQEASLSRSLDVVAVAWDGGRAAARALRDALPVIAQAGRVRLLTCSEDKPIARGSIDEISAFLSSHEVAVEHVPFGLEGKAIGEALQSAALAQDANLLVMGAYGHSRVREFLLGGATASVIKAPKLPTLLSH